MIRITEATDVGDVLNPKHEVVITCANCNYDLDEAEILADTCSDCGEVLRLRQDTKIYATSVPAASGSTLV